MASRESGSLSQTLPMSAPDSSIRDSGSMRASRSIGGGRASVGRNFPPCCLGVTLVSEMPFENGQIVCRDSVDAKTVEVMSYAASFLDSPFWRCSESRHFEPGVADESVVSDLRDIHRPARGRRSSGFCDGKAASTKKSLTVSLTVRGNRSA
jgi:hypothetical protein